MRFGLTVLAILALMVAGKDAEAQARGSLQATATVVDTRQGFEALSIVQQQLAVAKADRAHTVATVAQISTVPAEKAVVVTVDYSRN
jgi:hypothetical protein